jgi:hypothetical protein
VERGEFDKVADFLMSRQKDLDEDDKGENIDTEKDEDYEIVFKKNKKKKLWFKP